MIKLFYSSGSCSTSCHIALEESGLSYEAVQVDWDKPDANLAEVQKLNPLGVVPVLVSEEGKTITQNAAILEYIADKKPATHLLPPAGTPERAETTAWLSFVAADLHKSFGPLFQLEAIATTEAGRAEVRKWATGNVKNYLAHADRHLAGRDYLTGKQFTIADAYMFVVANWCQFLKINTEEYKNLGAYLTRVYQRPAVQKVMRAEGLLN